LARSLAAHLEPGVRHESIAKFDKSTADYSVQIAELDRKGKLDPQTGAELRNLLDRREFTTPCRLAGARELSGAQWMRNGGR
jgi:hypothetical protein